MLLSPHANVVRYTNGTLVKLTATATKFISPDYDFETGTGVYHPQSIKVTATFQGDIALGKWSYSVDGGTTFKDAAGAEGITVNGAVMTIAPNNNLFRNDSIVVRCTADDNEHYDTLTISREVDPVVVYRKTYTDISQTDAKIQLIASDEQLKQFTDSRTMMSKVAEMDLTAQNFYTNVRANYSTKEYVNTTTAGALVSANSYSDTVSQSAESSAKAFASQQASGAESSAKAFATAQATGAENSAKAFATTQATGAENSAKAFATQQATGAENNAKAFATAQATGAENNAKAFAEEKATGAENSAKAYAEEQAAGAESNAKNYADDVADEAEQNANGYTDTRLLSYPTTTEMSTAINQSAQSILLTASETYATKTELISVTDGIFTLQAPYTYANGVTTFTAKVFRNLEEVTSEFTDDQFEWYLKTEANPDLEYLGTGKARSVRNDLVGYGGTVTVRFNALTEPDEIIDASNNQIITETSDALTVVQQMPLELEVSLYSQNYISNKISALEVANDAITARVTEQYGTITGETDQKLSRLESELEITAEGITAEVERSAQGQTIISRINQTAETVTIQADKISLEGTVTANQNFKVLTDGSIQTIKADIGGIHVNETSIYSGSHSAVDSENVGFYLGSNGTASIGDASNYLKYKQTSGKWSLTGKFEKLTLNTSDSLVIGSSTAATQKDINNVKDTAKADSDEAAKTATNFLYYDADTGLVVSETGTAEGTNQKPHNVRVTSDGIRFRQGKKNLGYISGTGFVLYRPGTTTDKKLMELLSDGMYFYKTSNDTVVAKYTSTGLEVIEGTIADFTIKNNEIASQFTSNDKTYKVVIRSGKQTSVKAIEVLGGSDTPNFYLTYAGLLYTANALIGGVHVTNNSIYSDGHTGYNSETPGFFFGSGGVFSVGSDVAYFRYYKSNNQWRLEIRADAVVISGDNAATKSDITQVTQRVNTVETNATAAASEAAKTATNFLYYDDTNGLIVSQTGDVAGSEQKPYNVQVKGDGIRFRQARKNLGYISGSGFILYKPSSTDKKIMELKADGLYFYKTTSDDAVAKYTANGLEVITGTIANFTISGNEIVSQFTKSDKTYKIAIRSGTQTGTRAIEVFGGSNDPSFYLSYDGKLYTTNALIGNVNVSENAIYSGSHNKYDSTEPGYFLGSNGAFSVGNSTSYLRHYFKDNKWHLDMTADAVVISGENAATKSDITAITQRVQTVEGTASDAAKTASNFLYYDDTNGLIVSQTGDVEGTTQKPYNVQVKDGGIWFRQAKKNLGYISGSGFVLYRPNGTNKKIMELAENGLYFYKPSSDDVTAQYTANGFEVMSGKIADFTIGSALSSTYNSSSTGTRTVYIRPGKSTTTRAFEVVADNTSPFYVTYNGLLSTTNAEIGGIHVNETSIYSGNHTTYNSKNDGFMLGSTGVFSIGNDTSYLRFYQKDGKWYLDIRADSLLFGGGNTPATQSAIDTAVESVAWDASEALTVANTANTNASTALTTANSANTTANTANTTASTANTTANTANTTANKAKTAADEAKQTASTADTNASTALTTANSAKTTANTANTTANTANTTANNAQTAASEAKTAASNAAKTATNYICADGYGLHVSNNGTSYSNGHNVTITSSAVNINNKNVTMASFTGTSLTFYRSRKKAAEFGDNTKFYDSNGNSVITVSSSGMQCYNASGAGMEIADGVFKVIGYSGSTKVNTITIDGTGVTMKNTSGKEIFSAATSGGSFNFKNTINGTYINASVEVNGETLTGKKLNITSDGLSNVASISKSGKGTFTGLSILNSNGYEKASISSAGAFDCDGRATIRGGLSLPSNVSKVTDSDPGVLCFKSDGMTVGWKSFGTGSSKRYKDIIRDLTSDDVERFYDVHPVMAKYKPGHLSKGDHWEDVCMPMMIAEDIDACYNNSTYCDRDGEIRDYADHVVVSVHQQMLIDQNNRIKELESEVAELKALVKELLNGKKN